MAQSPNLNAHAERFVRSIKESCLDRMIFFGEAFLRKAVQEFVDHYHAERNHQGLANRIICPKSGHQGAAGTIRRRQRLGGMLNYSYRDAARRGTKLGCAPGIRTPAVAMCDRHEIGVSGCSSAGVVGGGTGPFHAESVHPAGVTE